MSRSIYNNQQRACEAQRHWSLPALRRARKRSGNPQRHPPRRMRPSRSLKIPRGQSFPPRFLLADCLGGCQGSSQALQGVSEVQLAATSTGFCTQDHSLSMSFCHLGLGYGGTIQDSTRRHDPSSCRRGQIHQVDRSKANQEVEWSDCRDFHCR